MKLTLEHLAPYLPYGLKVINTANGKIRSVDGLNVESGKNVRRGIYSLDIYDELPIEICKPILRPLSDLTKDEHFDMYMDLCEDLGLTRCEHLLLALKDKLYYAFDISKLEILEEFMYKNHFDWKYNLIDKNLAIDINTL